MDAKDKTIIGTSEEVEIIGKHKSKKVLARIDTGAKLCSIDRGLAHELELGPKIREAMIKSASGIQKRDIIKGKVRLAGRVMDALFTVADRSYMNFDALIGREALKKGYLIDPSIERYVEDDD